MVQKKQESKQIDKQRHTTFEGGAEKLLGGSFRAVAEKLFGICRKEDSELLLRNFCEEASEELLGSCWVVLGPIERLLFANQNRWIHMLLGCAFEAHGLLFFAHSDRWIHMLFAKTRECPQIAKMQPPLPGQKVLGLGLCFFY